MKLFTVRNAAAASSLILLTGVALVTSSSADSRNDPPGPPPRDVRVVNSAAQPVPVTGSLGISGTPTVNSQQSGDWNVSLAGHPAVGIDPGQNTVQLPPDASIRLGPDSNVGIIGTPAVGISPSSNTVQVGNTDQNPVKVQVVGGGSGAGAAPEPVVAQSVITAPDATTQNLSMDLYTVPPGKRLVIQDISAWSFAGQPSPAPDGTVVPTISALWCETSKAARFLDTDGQAQVAGAGDQTTLYVDSGDVVRFKAARLLGSRGGAGFQLRATITGVLEDAP